MGIYDRDHRQNDPWKKNNNKSHESELNEDIRNFNKNAKMQREAKAFIETLQLDDAPKTRNIFSYIPWILALLIILVIFKALNKHSSNDELVTKKSQLIEHEASTIIEPIPEIKSLPVPETSVLLAVYDEQTSKCPLTIIADNTDYYVKLFSTSENQTIASFFIRSGETLQTKIPAGQYAIKYGSGSKWQGEQELFGNFGRYGKSEALNFYDTGFSTQGHTISLYSTTNGNLQTSNVSREYVLQN